MSLLTLPRAFHVNSAGTPYGLAKLYHYRAGTLTTLNLYTTNSHGVAHAQPIEADANGVFPAFYINPSDGYDLRLILKDQNDVTIWDEDGIPRAESVFQTVSATGNISSGGVISATGNVTTSGLFDVFGSNPRSWMRETDRGTDLKNWDVSVEAGVMSFRTRTDADGAGKNWLQVTRGSTTVISAIAIGNGTDLPTITLNGTTLVATLLVQEDASTFTGTLTGVSGTVTGTMYYRKQNNVVTLYTPSSIIGTSTSTALTMTGLPAGLRPGGNRFCFCALMDNDAQIGGQAYLQASGTITFSTAFAGTGTFTAANQKGLFAGFTITYPL